MWMHIHHPFTEQNNQEFIMEMIPLSATVDYRPMPLPPQILPPAPQTINPVLPQEYIGRVNVVGDCYCFGVVVDRRPPLYKAVPILISVAGAATSVEALWAKLSQGKESAVVRDDRSPAIPLEPNKGGLYTRYQKKIDALGIDHLILVHENLAEPPYPTPGDEGEAGTAYLLCTSEAQTHARLGEHVRKTVKVAVFDSWFDYLYTEGRARGLVRDCIGYGVQALAVTLNAPKWTEVITAGLHQHRIRFPDHA
jgi:hypothetical protein